MGNVINPIGGALVVGVNAVQIVTVRDAAQFPYRLRFRNHLTDIVGLEETAASLQTKLRALRSIDGANITVSGSDGGPYTVTYIAALGSQPVPLLTANQRNILIEEDTAGVRESGHGMPTGAFFSTSEPAMYINHGTPTSPDLQAVITSPSDGLRVARGVHTQVGASDTIVTGLDNVVACSASFDTGPTLKQLFVRAEVGDQSGTPAAGSVLLKTFKPTAVDDVTPQAASDFSENLKIAWIALGT